MRIDTGTVVVTGGSGYVAGWCLVQLLQQGYTVRTTLRSPAKADAVRAAVATHVDTRGLSFVTADLTRDDGWADAMRGAAAVLHVASPLGGAGDLVGPARDGTLRVLRAALEAGVPRVVMTSSCAAATPAPTRGPQVVDEACWSDAEQPGLTEYRRSKVLAERAAWEFAAAHPGLQLTTLLPGAVFGPAIGPGGGGSLEVLGSLLDGRLPGIPRVALEVVDVRDVAAAHLLALRTPASVGERYIPTARFLWLRQVARMLREGLGDPGDAIPRLPLPDLAIRLAALNSPDAHDLVPLLGRRLWHAPDKAVRELGWRPREARATIVDSGRYLLGQA